MGLFRSIGRVFRSVTNIVSKVTNFVTKISNLLGPFTKILDKLGKLPFIGPLVSKVMPFLSKLGPLAFLAGGPLGVALGVLSKVTTAKTLLDTVGGFIRGGGGLDKFPAQAVSNLAQASAWQQARLFRA